METRHVRYYFAVRSRGYRPRCLRDVLLWFGGYGCDGGDGGGGGFGASAGGDGGDGDLVGAPEC